MTRISGGLVQQVVQAKPDDVRAGGDTVLLRLRYSDFQLSRNAPRCLLY